MEDIKFRVTRQDLKRHYGNYNDCAIATAYKRNMDSKLVVCGSDYLHDVTNRKDWVIRDKDNDKALSRADNSLWGRIMGGFEVVLTGNN